MKLFRFLAPAPHAALLSDPKQIQSNYLFWRMRIFLGIYIGYIFFYLARKSMTFAIPAMLEMGYTKSEMGMLATVISLSYGFSKFMSGILADRSNPRTFMAIGLILAGLMNICFSFCTSMIFFCLFTALNGYFQAWGAMASIRQLTHWFSQKERGRWWGIWTTAQNVGISSIAIFAAFLAEYQFGWRMSLWIPGILCILSGFFILRILGDTPQSVGLPRIEEFKNDFPLGDISEENRLTAREILFTYVLNNPLMWLLGFTYFFNYVIRQAVTDWGVLYLIETRNYPILEASACIVLFEAGGFAGSLLSGWISDLIFKGLRGPVAAIFSVLLICFLMGLHFLPHASYWINSTFYFMIGFVIYGLQCEIGIFASELTHKKASATANGFVGWIGYLGAAVAGWPLSMVCQTYGWGSFILVLAAGAFIIFCSIAPLWSIRKASKLIKQTNDIN